MKKLSIFSAALLIVSTGCAEEPAVSADPVQATNLPPALREKLASATNRPVADATPGTITVQEMLVSGPTQLKLHSLAMITQGNVKGKIDESYLPGLKACAEDPALPLRSVSAQVLGQKFVQGVDQPLPEAIALLVQLSNDDSADVRFNAIYHGLSQIENKSDTILNLLVDIASTHPQASLYDRIAEALQKDREKITLILDRKLQDENDIAIYEIYEDLAGKKPSNADKYLEMPSSRPHLFIFKGEGTDPEVSKSELEQALIKAGVLNADVRISGRGENYLLMLKTYLIKDLIAVNEAFADHPAFKITQHMWLTPEMEIQIEAMQRM